MSATLPLLIDANQHIAPLLLAGAKPAADAVATAPQQTGPIMMAVVQLCTVAVFVGMVLCLVRMVKGPHLADRVLAGDTLALHVLGLVILLAIMLKSTLFLDLALVIGILGFVSTYAFAQYIWATAGQGDNLPHPSPAKEPTS